MTRSTDSEDADPRALSRVGSVLDDKWTLERSLGSGGMGAVYAGRHRNGARGAVKVLHPELARRPDVRERFLREGYAANRVEHRGAVQVLDDDIIKDGPDEGTAYLVMEILEGESLEERIERGPHLTELELLHILDDVLAVLQAAHEHGVVHRDLKPANLFLNADPTGHGVKVLDFGLARLAELQSMTSAGIALGTPSFMAPEQASGRQDEIDARSDLFAIGATAFSILADRPVHEADGVIELVARMGTLPSPKLRDVRDTVSADVARIVDRALEFERADRYPSAAAMRDDVLAVLSARESPPVTSAHHQAITIVGGAPFAPDVASDAQEAPSSKAPVSTAPPTKRGRRGIGFGSVALLALFGVAGFLLVIFEPRVRREAESALRRPLGAALETDASVSNTAEPGDASNATSVPDASTALVTATLDDDPDASADEEEDDDDVDASDVAAIARGPATITSAHPIAKLQPPPQHPHPAPVVKKKGKKKKKRRW